MTPLVAGTTGRSEGQSATRVLVVDDSDQLVGLVGAWLEDAGYIVATATTGSRALAASVAEAPDVVLLDLILPPPDGFTICEVLQRRPRPPAIIVMTGIIDPMRLHRAEGLGAFAVLHKPLNEEAVLDAVSRARRQRWEDTAAAT